MPVQNSNRPMYTYVYALSENHNEDTNTVIPSSLEPYLGIVLVVSIAAAVVIVAPNCALDPREEKSLVRDNDGIFPCRGWGGNEG